MYRTNGFVNENYKHIRLKYLIVVQEEITVVSSCGVQFPPNLLYFINTKLIIMKRSELIKQRNAAKLAMIREQELAADPSICGINSTTGKLPSRDNQVTNNYHVTKSGYVVKNRY